MKTNLPDFLKVIRGDLDGADGDVDLLLAEPIGFDPNTYTGISSKEFGRILGSIDKKRTVNLLINTMGGRTDEGTSMCNMLLARGNVTTCVIGYAASMGAIIMQGGSKRQMMPGTMCVIHNPWGTVTGDHRDATSAGEVWKKVKDNMASFLADRTGLSKKKISDMMDAETYMTPEEAVELGFADEIVNGSETWNSIDVETPAKAMQNFRRMSNSVAAVQPPVEAEEKKTKSMKLITAALAKAKLITSADLTEESAIVSAFETGFASLSGLQAKNGELENRVKKFEASQKIRVEARVAKAIEDKLVKPERKDALITEGMADEDAFNTRMGDLEALKAQTGTNPPTRRPGAPPVPPETPANESNEAKITELRAKLAETNDPAQKTTIARQIRDLRGHKDLFAAPAAAK